MVAPAEDGQPGDGILRRSLRLSRSREPDALNEDGHEGEEGRKEQEDKEQVEEWPDRCASGSQSGSSSAPGKRRAYEASISSLLSTTSSPTRSSAPLGPPRGEMLVWVEPSRNGGSGVCLASSCSSFHVRNSDRYDARETKVEGILMSSVFSAGGAGRACQSPGREGRNEAQLTGTPRRQKAVTATDPTFRFALVTKDDSFRSVLLGEADLLRERAFTALDHGDPGRRGHDRCGRDGEGGTGISVGGGR